MFYCHKHRIFYLSINIEKLENRITTQARCYWTMSGRGKGHENSGIHFKTSLDAWRLLKAAAVPVTPEDRGERNGTKQLLKPSMVPYKQIVTPPVPYFYVQLMSKYWCAEKLSQDQTELIMCVVEQKARMNVDIDFDIDLAVNMSNFLTQHLC